DDAVTFRLAREFPRPDEASWIEYRHYNEKKLGKSRRADFPPFIGRLVDDLNAPEFVAWLSELTGIRGLVADPDLDGGGLHQTERAGFLNIHADFTMHHHRPNWRRRCNLILFLNEGWDDTWRGALRALGPEHEGAGGADRAALQSCDRLQHHRGVVPRLPGPSHLPARRHPQEHRPLLLHGGDHEGVRSEVDQLPRAARGRREGGPDLARQAAARRLLACEI